MGGMTRLTALLCAILWAAGAWGAEEWAGESRFSLGLEHHSRLYEFEPGDAGAVFSALRVGGGYSKARQSVAYHFTVLDPWGGSSADPPPARMLYGGLEYRAGAALGAGLVLDGSARYQFRDAQGREERFPVEEDPYTRFGAEAALRWHDRLRLALDWSDLEVQDRTVFSHRQTRASLAADQPLGGRHRLRATAAYAVQDFDQPVLVIPAGGGSGGPPTPPSFRDHRDTLRLVSLGWEVAGPFLVQAALFYQETDSSIPDFGHTGWGIEGTLSAAPAPGWTLLLSFRFEDRRLERSYLLFDPRVLTEAATNFVALRLRRSLGRDLEVEAGLGRYLHDVREDFFSDSGARIKSTLAVTLKL